MMKFLNNYKAGFEIWGLALFLLVMIPNFIWFGAPAPNDVLRADSVTPITDMIASVCQVMFVAALCFITRKDREKLKINFLTSAVICCLLIYFAGWVFYYGGYAGMPVITALTLPPCLAFVLFALDRKNFFAAIPAVVFTVCHCIYGIVNFII